MVDAISLRLHEKIPAQACRSHATSWCHERGVLLPTQHKSDFSLSFAAKLCHRGRLAHPEHGSEDSQMWGS